MDNTSQMYFLQIDPAGVLDTPIETEAIPFRMVVNNIPEKNSNSAAKDFKQLYIGSTIEDQSPLNFINSQKFFNYSLNVQPNLGVALLGDNTAQAISATSECHDNGNNILENSFANEVQLRKNKRTLPNGIVHLVDRVVPPRAVAVLPAALYLRRGCVVPRRSLAPRVKFGPVKGIKHQTSQETAYKLIMKAKSSKVAIFLTISHGCISHIDVSDQDKSNWFSLLPLGTQSTANLWLYQENDELYGISVHAIATRTPLILGYSKQYADDWGIPSTQPILDISQELSGPPNPWWCNECERAFPTVSQLQRHVDVHHKVDTKPRKTRRGRYRCRSCGLTFSRFFSLKRHATLYCTKKGEDADTRPQSVARAEPATLNIDDTRLPSDESLQNFTNGLDFSTSLFDTDRISNLDISGSSKSETEFNPYGNLTADMDFLNNDVDKNKKIDDVDKQNVQNEPLLVSCPHCNQTIVREKKAQHLSECRERNLKCECGRIFQTKEKLGQHIQIHHRAKLTKEQSPKAGNKNFKCEKCPLSYTRRGMLVNHMWRVHKVSGESLPLERRVFHYPCVACPKLYRTASKRDRHVRNHHPGVELVKGSSIEGGTRSCEPASCPACPRQYVTRAKMLQHLRAEHPDVAPPVKKSTKSKACSKKQHDITAPAAATLNPTPAFNYYE